MTFVSFHCGVCGRPSLRARHKSCEIATLRAEIDAQRTEIKLMERSIAHYATERNRWQRLAEEREREGVEREGGKVTESLPGHATWCDSNYAQTEAPYRPKPCNCAVKGRAA